jgi:hypothetical protein
VEEGGRYGSESINCGVRVSEIRMRELRHGAGREAYRPVRLDFLSGDYNSFGHGCGSAWAEVRR